MGGLGGLGGVQRSFALVENDGEDDISAFPQMNFLGGIEDLGGGLGGIGGGLFNNNNSNSNSNSDGNSYNNNNNINNNNSNNNNNNTVDGLGGATLKSMSQGRAFML